VRIGLASLWTVFSCGCGLVLDLDPEDDAIALLDAGPADASVSPD